MAAPTDDETTTASTTLQMNAVTVERGTKTLVDNINWAVEVGQRWVVLGRNGSGKTTLLRLASLYLHPSSGRIEVLGEALGHTDVRLLRRRIGLVSPAMADLIRPDLTPRDIVMSAKFAALEPWWHAYADHDRERAVECLAQMGVEQLATHRFNKLSSGERQRVLLARALMADVELVLLDEPTAGLDLFGREELLRYLDALGTRPNAPTQILVTHHVEEIPSTYTHVLGMVRGSAVGQGPLAQTLTSDFVSEVFGIDVLVEQTDGRYSARLVR